MVVIMSEEPPTPEEEEQEEEVEELTPDMLFFLRIRDALGVFSVRQNELLRLAGFMDERAAEIDNATQRARELIRGQLDEIDETAIDQLVTLFTELDQADLGDGDLSPEDRQSAISTALQEITEGLPDGVASTYMDGVLRAVHAPPGVGILRSSLLVSLVGELEMLVDFLARACYERQPSALQDSGRQFTWGEIAEYESIDELRDHVVDRMIEDVLRGSLSEWVDHFVRKFKVAPISLAGSFAAQEIVQRRHCIVHNAGQVSVAYIDRLSQFDLKVEVGDDLEVSSEYLQEAADTLYLIAFSLSWALGFKLISEPDAIDGLETTFANRSYFLLRDRRYELVCRIGKEAPLSKIDESSRFVIQVNYWLAHKLAGKFEVVRQEVEGLEVATRSRNYNLAKHALLDEYEDAYRIAQSMIRDESLKPEHFFTWPLLAGVRDFARRKNEAE